MKDRNDDFKTLKQYCFRELRLSGRDVEILRLCAGKNTVPGDLSSFFETVVFNELQGQQACALASLGQRMDFRGVPEALLPRLKGATNN